MILILIFNIVFFTYSFGQVIYNENLITLNKKCFTLHYLPIGKIPRYSEYTLLKENVEEKPYKRIKYFSIDKTLKKLKIPYAKSSDYTRKGKDRSHLVSNNAFNDNLICQKETFKMSNVIPLYPKVNRIVMKRYEDFEILLAKKYGKVKVITGDCGKIGQFKEGEIIPKYVYKIIKIKNNSINKTYYVLFKNKKDIKNVNYFTTKENLEKTCNIIIK